MPGAAGRDASRHAAHGQDGVHRPIGPAHRDRARAWACWGTASISSISGTPRCGSGMSGYLLPFEIVSVHLLVVLIGAAYLARTKRRTDGIVLIEIGVSD